MTRVSVLQAISDAEAEEREKATRSSEEGGYGSEQTSEPPQDAKAGRQRDLGLFVTDALRIEDMQ